MTDFKQRFDQAHFKLHSQVQRSLLKAANGFLHPDRVTAQKMKFSNNDVFSKCDQIPNFL